jgi:hypothetical protein
MSLSQQTRIRAALAAGLGAVAVAAILTVSHAPDTLAGTNWVPEVASLGATRLDIGACQAGETLPRGTTAIRLGLQGSVGPRVTVVAYAGSSAITRGSVGPGWRGENVIVPVRAVPHAVSHARVCFKLSSVSGNVSVVGAEAPPAQAAVAQNGVALPGRMQIEYLRPGRASWWSQLLPVLRHMGLGRAAAGTWIAIPIAALAAGAFALAAWAVARELG